LTGQGTGCWRRRIHMDYPGVFFPTAFILLRSVPLIVVQEFVQYWLGSPLQLFGPRGPLSFPILISSLAFTWYLCPFSSPLNDLCPSQPFPLPSATIIRWKLHLIHDPICSSLVSTRFWIRLPCNQNKIKSAWFKYHWWNYWVDLLNSSLFHLFAWTPMYVWDLTHPLEFVPFWSWFFESGMPFIYVPNTLKLFRREDFVTSLYGSILLGDFYLAKRYLITSSLKAHSYPVKPLQGKIGYGCMGNRSVGLFQFQLCAF